MSGNTFFIADPHFGHENIIKYEKRPFLNVEEMDRFLIEKWNSIVKNNDEVFVLGDFSFYTKAKTKQICNELKGRKYLIKGNHDKNSDEFYTDCGFEFVSKYPIIYKQFWMLSHEPLYLNENMPYANIFGHVHANKAFKDYSAQSYCVSVERIGYEPIPFKLIKEAVEGI